MKAIALSLTALLCAAAPARADDDEAARAERWQDLKHAVFGDRLVTDGGGVIALDAPARALDAAVVPITITLSYGGNSGIARIKTVYVLVDGNPSPLAGTFKFGPAADPRTLKTRVRVDQYTLLHAVAETEDGRLFATERYVKAAGGCSAPSSKDPHLAMSRMGQTRARLDGDTPLQDGQPATVTLLVSHPNNNGMQVDQLSHNFIPARYLQDIDIRYGNEPVLDIQADISLSEDPAITFSFIPHGPGPLQVNLEDSTKATWHSEFALGERS